MVWHFHGHGSYWAHYVEITKNIHDVAKSSHYHNSEMFRCVVVSHLLTWMGVRCTLYMGLNIFYFEISQFFQCIADSWPLRWEMTFYRVPNTNVKSTKIINELHHTWVLTSSYSNFIHQRSHKKKTEQTVWEEIRSLNMFAVLFCCC